MKTSKMLILYDIVKEVLGDSHIVVKLHKKDMKQIKRKFKKALKDELPTDND